MRSGGGSTEQQLVHAPQPLPLGRIVDLADELVEAVAHARSSSSSSAEPRERAPRPRLDRAERHVQELGDLALREAAPVGELDHGALVLRELLERAVHAPREPRRLGLLGRPALAGRLVGQPPPAAPAGCRAPSTIALRATV